MRICYSCGYVVLLDDLMFCPNCGALLSLFDD